MAGVLCSLLWPLLLVPLLLPHTAAGPRYSSRIVDTQSGAIRGIILEPLTRHLEPVEAFLGVPYASVRRFYPPMPPQSWQGTKLADSFGPVCPQNYPDVSNRTSALSKMPKGRYQVLKKMVPFLTNQSEECLFLNIYIPGSGNRGVEAPYAVLMWVHGDSYEWGSGNPYDGSVLASHGHIILITLNFRLGILGFLKTRAGNKPGVTGGNLALLDLSAALRWIKNNLHNFGGDPTRVTLLGHGQGAALANLLLLTTEAKGLFHRLILLSGSALSPWALVHDPDSIREAVSEQLGCNNIEIETKRTKSYEDIASCLEDKPLEALLSVSIQKPSFIPRWGPHQPIDSEILDPVYAMEVASDSFITCSLLLGVTTTESYYDFSASDIQYGFEEEYRNRVFRTFVRNSFVYHLNEIYAAIRNEYMDWDKPVQHPINVRDSTMEALSDGHTAAPMLRVAALHARRGATTYLMHFAYQTKDGDYPQRLGSVRGEQIPFVLGLPLVNGLPHFPSNYSRQDASVSEALLSLFVSFTKTGDPNPKPGDTFPQYVDYGRERNQYKGVPWNQYEPSTQRYLSFGLKPKMKSHYRGHKMALWLNLIPQLHQPGTADVSMRHHHFRESEPHYYMGPVRPESFTLLFGRRSNIVNRVIPTDCQPTETDGLEKNIKENDDGDENNAEAEEYSEEVKQARRPDVGVRKAGETDTLQKIADKNYSYTSALGVTVGIGCFLLMLNMILFLGIYYQQGKRRKIETLRKQEQTGDGDTETEDRSRRDSSAFSNTSDTNIQIRDDSVEISEPVETSQDPPPLYRAYVPPTQTQREKITNIYNGEEKITYYGTWAENKDEEIIVFCFMAEGKNFRRRPRREYLEDLCEDVSCSSYCELKRAAQVRPEWKRRCILLQTNPLD